MRLEIPRRSEDQAVEVIRVTLDLEPALAASVRAGLEVVVLCRLPVEGADEPFRGNRGEVLGAIQIVDGPLAVSDGPPGVGRDVSGVGRDGRVAPLQIGGHARVADRADVSSLAVREEFLVPSGRKPRLEVDVRLAGRPAHADQPAEGRQVVEGQHPGRSGHGDRPRRHQRRGGDGGVSFGREYRQVFACDRARAAFMGPGGARERNQQCGCSTCNLHDGAPFSN